MSALDPLDQLLVELPPWLRCLAIALCERHLLQADLRLICQTQLEDSERTGPLPGREGWSYIRAFDDKLMLTLEGKPTKLDIDLSSSVEELERFGILLELLPPSSLLHSPTYAATPAVEQVRRWLTTADLLTAALDLLVERGVLERLGDEAVSFAPPWAGVLEKLNRLDDHQEEYARLVGREEDEDQRDEWRRWLLEISAKLESSALIATHEELEASDVERIVMTFLRAALGAPTVVALQVAKLRELEVPAAALEALINQIEPSNAEGVSPAVMAVADYALDHDIARSTVIAKLLCFGLEAEELKFTIPDDASEAEVEGIWQHVGDLSFGVPGIDEAARLLLEYAPDRCLPTIRRALRDDGLLTAVRLIAIGQPWAIHEVAAAAPEVRNPQMRQTFVGVLERRGHELAALRAKDAVAGAELTAPFGMGMDSDLDALGDAVTLMAVEAVERLAVWAADFRAKVGEDFDPAD